MPPSKFEANPTLRRGLKRASFSFFTLIIDFLADRLVLFSHR